jgi:predicted alpha-1,2-mannosidase
MKIRHGRRAPWIAACAAAVAMSMVVPATANAAPKEPSTPPTEPAATAAQSNGRITDFASSLETADAQPDWANTVETDAKGNKKSDGVTGSASSGIPGNIMDKVDEVTANGENSDAGEVAANVADGDIYSKWLVFESTGWLQFKLNSPQKVVHYALTSANDAPERDPMDWNLQGSADGATWTTLDTQSGQAFPTRFLTKEYRFANDTAYPYYRINITRNGGVNLVQLAELQLSDGSPAPPGPQDMSTTIGKGPASAPAAKTSVGYTGLRALVYSGTHTTEGRGYSYNKVFDVDVKVTRASELSYRIFPEFMADDLSYPSTYAAVDLAFTDGTYLSDLGAKDQHGFTLSPQGQGKSKSLYTNQWNHKVAKIGDVARGKTIDRILVAYDNPDGPAKFRGWVDDLKIVGSPVRKEYDNPSDYVLTTRGTHSTGSFSRGNNIPATAVPHGFNFWTPVTNAGTTSWLYDYHKGNNAANLPALQAFSTSHEPSPWMGDRQTFQVMPSGATGVPNASRTARALPFRHENEVASPHYYSVKFENGLKTEIAPTDHAALLRFTFTGDESSLIFDNVNNNGGLTLDPANRVVTGYSDVRSGLSNGATRLFVYGSLDTPVKASGPLPGGGGANVTGYTQFDTSAKKVVQLKIATSLISINQAKKNLDLEIGAGDSLESVRRKAQKLWDERLSVIEVEGASQDQLTTLYSNLYRLYLYPNSGHENVGTTRKPVWKHAVQSSTTTPPSTPTETGAPVVDGKVYVNNGFWDTYRTTWSAYSFFTPKEAGELVDGFVQQYKDGGWVSRWSSPGYANLMTGTSSDVSFADAYVKGIKNFDVKAAYDAAVKNASVAPPGTNPNNPSVGRKGLQTSVFRGYTSSDVSEGVSWALEGYINDFGIANMAKALSERKGATKAERQRYCAEAEYYLNRAQNYINMFDPGVGFFQGRAADGTWKSTPTTFDPREWGHEHDYTETDGWNFAFHVPQDGQGLANLYGGKQKLAEKLDTFFATPETAQFPGSYGGIIHEMTEARDVRMGQWGFSNQVSHHIPWMYNYAGQPSKTQAKVREVLSRLYVGSELGQGYAGDEDNGETSAWYLFAALGFYPLQMGSPYYAVGSPLFTKATVKLENGRKLVVKAPKNSAKNIYVQGLKVNGERYSKTYLPHDVLARGGVVEFDLGAKPSKWGTGKNDAPRSITEGDAVAKPLRDVAGTASASAGTDPAGLFDNSSGTRVALAGDAPWVQFQPTDPKQKVTFYTLTSADVTADPAAGWVLKGSNDGVKWKVLDRRRAETFQWRLQTRAFKVDDPGKYAHYRLEFTGAGASLAEIELLAKPGS